MSGEGNEPVRKSGESLPDFIARCIRYHQGAERYWRERLAEVEGEAMAS